jgi:NDP-sugar pyrophosphorylase family protein
MKIIIPMAGLGSRFTAQGHSCPKPLITFLGKPMIQHVTEHLGLLDLPHIFLCQTNHIEQYNLTKVCSKFVKNFTIVPVNGLTNGAATTVSLAKSVVKKDDEVILVNSDQLLHWDRDIASLVNNNGTIFCFTGEGNKWSYATTGADGNVTKVAEKVQISNCATAGMYHWKRFGDYLEAYEKMVAANDRTNNEFYVAPVYNYALDLGIKIKYVDEVEQVGTPEELALYLQAHEYA